MLLDFVFQRYSWTYPDVLELPEYLWQRLAQVWAAEGAYSLKLKGTSKKPLEGAELISAARSQGFDLPPNVTPSKV